MVFSSWQEFLPERAQLRARGQKLVFTNGCFDLLHPGHLQTLAAASALGDVLLVAVNTDASVRRAKGPDRPLIPQAERAEVLDALESVDFVTFFDDDTPLALIVGLRPDVLVKGADWGEGAVVGEPEVLASGGRVERIALAPGYSTSAILAAIRSGVPLG